MIKKARTGYKIVEIGYRGDFEIPNKWNLEKLKQITKFEYGKGLTEENRDNGEFPVYGSGGIVGKHSEYLKEKPGIIIARKGSLGNIFYAEKNFWPIDTVYYITQNETKQELKFLYYLLNYLKLEKYAITTATPGINRDDVYAIYVRIPSLPEQQKIASILSGIDALIQNTSLLIEKSIRLKKGLMQKLLTRGIGHTKFKKVPGLFGKKIKIPEEWEIKNIKMLFEFLRTGTNSRSDLGNGTIQYIHYGDIHTKWNGFLDCDLEEIPLIEKTKVETLPLLIDGDIIIADASEDHEGSGTSILLKNVRNKKIVSGLHTIALRDNNKNFSLDFRAYLISIRFVKSQIISYVTGVSVYGLSKKNLEKIRIPIPPLPEQQKIASILSGVDAVRYNNAVALIILHVKFTIHLILFVTILYYEFYNTEKNIHHYHNS